MKKKLIMLAMSLLVITCLFGCGKKEVDDTEEFNAAYKEAYSAVETFETNTQNANAFVVSLWDEVGPDYLYDFLNFIKITTSPDEFISEWHNYGGDAVTAHKMMDVMNGLYGYSESIADAKNRNDQSILMSQLQKSMYETNTSFEALVTEDEDVKGLISDLYSNYGEKHKEQIDKLNDYYIQVSVLREKTLAPEGSYNNFTEDITSIKTEISGLKKTAELY